MAMASVDCRVGFQFAIRTCIIRHHIYNTVSAHKLGLGWMICSASMYVCNLQHHSC